MGQCAQHNDYQSVCCTIMLQILERGKTGGLLMSIMGGYKTGDHGPQKTW